MQHQKIQDKVKDATYSLSVLEVRFENLMMLLEKLEGDALRVDDHLMDMMHDMIKAVEATLDSLVSAVDRVGNIIEDNYERDEDDNTSDEDNKQLEFDFMKDK